MPPEPTNATKAIPAPRPVARSTPKQTPNKKSHKATKTTVQTTAIAKIPQARGGALNSGGTPGNKGGGRTTNEVQALATELTHNEVIPTMRKIMKGAEKDSDRISAGQVIAKLVPRKDENVLTLPNVEAICRGYAGMVISIIERLAPQQAPAIIAEIEAGLPSLNQSQAGVTT